MSEKTHTASEVSAALAKVIKSKVETFADQVKTLRAKELSKSESKGGKLSKAELCPLCGNPDRPDTCTCLRKNAEAGYGPNGEDLSLAKVAPPGEEKLVHKLKDEYGHDEEGKRKAFATAWAIKNKTVKKNQMPSSSASALAPKAPKPATPVAQVNHELGGFKSVVNKAEGSAASPDYGSRIVPPSGTVTEGKKSKKIAAPGSGGEITKGKNLAKAGLAAAAKVPGKPKAVTGVPGKQPVGEGGGDAFKVPATSGYPGAKLPGHGVSAFKGVPGKGAKPTSVGTANKELAGFQSIASNPTAMPTGGALVGPTGGQPPAATAKPSSMDRIKAVLAGGAKKPDALQNVRDQMNLKHDMKAAGVGWIQRLLASRKPAPTVTAPPPGGTNPFGRAQHSPYKGIRGAAALARSEKAVSKAEPLMKKPALDMGSCAMCSKSEHRGMCKMEMAPPTAALSGVNHNRRMLRVK